MVSTTPYIILCLTSLLFLPINTNPISPFTSNSYCGGTLSRETGGISYKSFEQFSAGERCVWILRVPRAASYNVVLYNRGMTSSSEKVIATALSRDKAEVHTLLSVIDRNYFINGSVAVITFYTYSTAATQTGFSLYYDTVLSENNQVSPSSLDYIISSNAAEIRHPRVVGGSYGHNELSTFVFTPNFLWVNNQRLTVNVTVLGMEQNCDEMITVYYLPGSTTNSMWRRMGRICGVDHQVRLSNIDVILLVFQSDESVANSGFQLSYNIHN